MNQQTIEKINEAIKHHTNFPNRKSTFKKPLNRHSSGYYLATMDRIALAYDGRTPSERLSNVLKEYYRAINVKSLTEAINYVAELDS